jgi:hypothetical protein
VSEALDIVAALMWIVAGILELRAQRGRKRG